MIMQKKKEKPIYNGIPNTSFSGGTSSCPKNFLIFASTQLYPAVVPALLEPVPYWSYAINIT